MSDPASAKEIDRISKALEWMGPDNAASVHRGSCSDVAEYAPLQMNNRLNELHQSIGEFLTEQSRVESAMFGICLLAGTLSLRDSNFGYYHLTFGQKIDKFKASIAKPPFDAEDQAELSQVHSILTDLLPQRDDLIHGETLEFGFAVGQTQPYRIGINKRNPAPLPTISAKEKNTYSVERVRQVGDRCRSIREILTAVSQRHMARFAASRPTDQQLD